MTEYFQDYPLKDITYPHPHDVLMGRGGGTNSHLGNSHWRMLVNANKTVYLSLPKKQKMLLSRSIVQAVRCQRPPGRFLQHDLISETWYDVGDRRAQEKTSQALREGANVLRDLISKQPEEDETNGTPTAEEYQSSMPPYITRSSSASGTPMPLFSGNGHVSQPLVSAVANHNGVVSPPPPMPPPVPPQVPSSALKSPPPPKNPVPDQVTSSSHATRLTSSVSSPPTPPLTTTQDVLENQEEENDYENEKYDQFPEIVKRGITDPPEFSIGTLSMMSLGSAAQGTSFGSVSMTTENLPVLSIGSAMSCTATPETVPAGQLEPMGIRSLGTLSWSSMDQHQLREVLIEAPDPMPTTYETPTFLVEQKSTDNLLECSDTESETEEEASNPYKRNRSDDWERIQATLKLLATTGDHGHPPAPDVAGSASHLHTTEDFGGREELERNVTSTTLNRTELEYGFSALSLDETSVDVISSQNHAANKNNLAAAT